MKNEALLIIDVQKGLDSPAFGSRSNPDAETNMELLLLEWRNSSQPVIHVKHNSTEENSTLRPDVEGNEIKDFCVPLPGERLFEKSVNSAFIGTDLESHLRNQGIENLVVFGLTTDHCVSTSVRMAANLGFSVCLVADATATFERTSYDGTSIPAEQMHEVNLATLHNEFCTVITTAQALERVNS